MTPEDEEDNYLDEIKREGGLERFWLFYNGQWAESIAGLIAAIGGILSCFIYILGYSKSILGYVLAGIAIIGFVCWRFLFFAVKKGEESGWRKSKRTVRAERTKVKVAALLWLFIMLSVCTILIAQWRHPH